LIDLEVKQTTSLIMDLYFKGISLRGIKDHLKQFYNLSLDPSNIMRRIHKFSKVINDYICCFAFRIESESDLFLLFSLNINPPKYLSISQKAINHPTLAIIIDSIPFWNTIT
jgi:hypothetical protein